MCPSLEAQTKADNPGASLVDPMLEGESIDDGDYYELASLDETDKGMAPAALEDDVKIHMDAGTGPTTWNVQSTWSICLVMFSHKI